MSNRSLPSFLNPTSSTTEFDRPLVESEFLPVWTYFEPYVYFRIWTALGRVSLHRAASLASAKGEHSCLLASPGAVREALSRLLPNDISQDIAIALLLAIRRGALRASYHCIRAWLRKAVSFTVRKQVRQPATLCFAAGRLTVQDSEEEREDPAEAHARVEIECLVELRERLAWLSGILEPRQFAVLKARIEGAEYEAIGAKFGLTPGNARILLCRARKAAVQALKDREEHGAEARKSSPSSCGGPPAWPGEAA